MNAINLADAKAHLSQLVEQASGGEAVQIMRRGKIVAQITSVERKRKPIELGILRKLTDIVPEPAPCTASTVLQMRDEARY